MANINFENFDPVKALKEEYGKEYDRIYQCGSHTPATDRAIARAAIGNGLPPEGARLLFGLRGQFIDDPGAADEMARKIRLRGAGAVEEEEDRKAGRRDALKEFSENLGPDEMAVLEVAAGIRLGEAGVPVPRLKREGYKKYLEEQGARSDELSREHLRRVMTGEPLGFRIDCGGNVIPDGWASLADLADACREIKYNPCEEAGPFTGTASWKESLDWTLWKKYRPRARAVTATFLPDGTEYPDIAGWSVRKAREGLVVLMGEGDVREASPEEVSEKYRHPNGDPVTAGELLALREKGFGAEMPLESVTEGRPCVWAFITDADECGWYENGGGGTLVNGPTAGYGECRLIAGSLRDAGKEGKVTAVNSQLFMAAFEPAEDHVPAGDAVFLKNEIFRLGEKAAFAEADLKAAEMKAKALRPRAMAEEKAGGPSPAGEAIRELEAEAREAGLARDEARMVSKGLSQLEAYGETRFSCCGKEVSIRLLKDGNYRISAVSEGTGRKKPCDPEGGLPKEMPFGTFSYLQDVAADGLAGALWDMMPPRDN